jgi:hypothetical protein
LGPLGPHETKTVSVVLAATSGEPELARVLAGSAFPPRDLSDAGAAEIATAERLVGGWVAAFPPNDLVARTEGDTISMNLMGCCFPAGVRGLYACWKATFGDDGHTLSVRLPIDRRGDAAFQRVTEGPDRVRQSIRLLAPRRLRVRIPDWAPLDQVEVHTESGRRRPFVLAGRWMDFSPLAAGTTVALRYPLLARTTAERVGGNGRSLGFCPVAEKRTFTAHWRGNVVVRLEPRGEFLPLFP